MASILVIDDSERQRAEVRAVLESSRLFDRVIEASDGIEGLKLFLSESPDLVLCDLEMPGLDGEKLLRMRQGAGDAERDVPFIVLTAVTDPLRRARLLEQGASDTITKPFHAADLNARLRLHLKLVQTQNELILKNHELERLSRTDSLTGIANRRHLEEMLSAEFKRSCRHKIPFSVVMADIDFFKQVNDEHGHPTGDAVLTRVAETMQHMVRETDLAGRFGGEEFLAILGNNDCAGAAIFAERLRQAIESMTVELQGGATVSITISIGLACWTPDLSCPQPIIRWADEALYHAKASGRNRVSVYSRAEGDSAGTAESSNI